MLNFVSFKKKHFLLNKKKNEETFFSVIYGNYRNEIESSVVVFRLYIYLLFNLKKI